MQAYRADLHVHTVLSPCAQVEMIPPLIIAAAQNLGLQLLAVTDHNASANVIAVKEAACAAGISILPGMELQTREEVHVLCLFDDLEQMAAFQKIVDVALPERMNDAEFFGSQFVVDATGDFIREEPRLLLTSTSLSVEAAVEAVHKLGGLAIPAHVDRQAFSLIATLGFIPPELPIDAVEITRRMTPAAARDRFPQLRSYPLVIGGDAHHPDELLGAACFEIEAPTIAEIRLALKGQAGRSLSCSVSPIGEMHK